MPSPGASARAGGVRWERVCVQIARSFGWAEARRGMQFRQGVMTPTTVPDVEGTNLWWECARSRTARFEAAVELVKRKRKQAVADQLQLGTARPILVAVSAGRSGSLQLFGVLVGDLFPVLERLEDACKSSASQFEEHFGTPFFCDGGIVIVERSWKPFVPLMQHLRGMP